MSLAEHANSHTSSSSTGSSKIDVIVTSCGGDDMPRAAYRSGARVGMSSAKKRPPEEIPIEFVDWPFLEDGPFDEKWTRHLEVVKRERPKYAVAPDINAVNPYESVIPKADQLRRYAEVVIVVPKAVPPSRVPDRFRVGLPAQKRFGGNPHNVWEYRHCPSVHILGGSPKTQFELSNYVQVDSVDTSSPLKAAEFGSVWIGSPDNSGSNWGEVGSNYYERIERSMNNLFEAWNQDERLNEDRINRARREVEMPQIPTIMPDELKARPQSRDELCIGAEEEHPFPGREYFYRDDTLSYSEWLEEYRGEEPGWE